MSQTFEVRRNSVAIGCFTSSQLREMARDGRLLPNDVIHDPLTGRTSQAAAIKSLSGVFQPVKRQQAPPLPDVFPSPLDVSGSLPLHRSAAGLPPPPPPPLGAPGLGDMGAPQGSAVGAGASGDDPLWVVSLLMRGLGGLCVAIGVADLILYNARIFDIYAGIPFISGNVGVSFFTAMIAIGVGSHLLRVGGGKRPSVPDYVVGAAGCLIPMIVAISLLLIGIGGIPRGSRLADCHEAMNLLDDRFVEDFNQHSSVAMEWAASESAWVDAINATDDGDQQIELSEAYLVAVRSCGQKSKSGEMKAAFGDLEKSVTRLIRSLRGEIPEKADACLRECEQRAQGVSGAFFEARGRAFAAFAGGLPDVTDRDLPESYVAAMTQIKEALQEGMTACSKRDGEAVERSMEALRAAGHLLNMSAKANGMLLEED